VATGTGMSNSTLILEVFCQSVSPSVSPRHVAINTLFYLICYRVK